MFCGTGFGRRRSGCGGLVPTQTHGRLDIGDFESGFVVAHRRVSASVVHRNALDARHLANPLLHFVDAQYRQHGVHFHHARFHRISPFGFFFFSIPGCDFCPSLAGRSRDRNR